MSLRRILKYPDERLRLISKKVEDPFSPQLQQLVEDMAETMYASNGAGLAAIQVGEPLRLFIIDSAIAKGEEKDPPFVFINPEFIKLSREKEVADEGCLSFPGIYVPVARSLKAKIRAMNLRGEMFELEGTDLLARALQHEADHLNGKLLADFVGRIKRQLIARRIAKAEAAQEP